MVPGVPGSLPSLPGNAYCHLTNSSVCLGEQHYKVEVYQQQIDMEKLSHQGELLLKKVSDQTDRDMIQEPLTELRHLWDNLGDKITQRQVSLPPSDTHTHGSV